MAPPLADRTHPLVFLAPLAALMVAVAEDRVLMLAVAGLVLIVLAGLAALDRPRRQRRR